ncbi:MAG: efflux RND transporter periplasmic adaptor subunit [Gemmatimonadaceae bacterium]
MKMLENRALIWTRGAAIVVAAALVAGCGGAPPASSGATTPPPTIRTVVPSRGPITRTITLPSFRILALQSATLYAKVSGYLKTIMVDKGDAVKEGQVLAQIEVPELQADETQLKAEAEVTRGNYERMAAARQKAPDLVVPQTVDDLRGQSQVAAAKLQRTEALLAFARITAPFTGVVTARYVDPGAFIPAATTGSTPQGAALVTVMDESRLRVQVYVPEAEVPLVRDGLPATITVDELPGRTFRGTVTRFANALDESTKTMLTEIELPNASGVLRAGMYASVRLDVERRANALLVPAEAVVVEKAGTSVFVVTGNTVHKRPVKTGFRDATHVEITDGVAAGDVLAVAGKQGLTDGQTVSVAKP